MLTVSWVNYSKVKTTNLNMHNFLQIKPNRFYETDVTFQEVFSQGRDSFVTFNLKNINEKGLTNNYVELCEEILPRKSCKRDTVSP